MKKVLSGLSEVIYMMKRFVFLMNGMLEGMQTFAYDTNVPGRLGAMQPNEV